MKRRSPPKRSASSEIEALRTRLQEAEDTLDAIRKGHVEALVVSAPEGPKIYTLEGADHRYRRLVETMNEGALLVSQKGVIVYTNAAFASIVGHRLETIIGRSFSGFVARASHDALEALFKAGRVGADADEILLCHRSGEPVSTYLSMSPNSDGESGVCVIVTNLTFQKRSEEIVASERLARSILDQVAEAIIVCDEDGSVVRTSRAARAIAADDTPRQHVFVAFPLRANTGSEGIAHPASLALEGKVSTGLEMVLDVSGRPPLSVLCSAAPLLNDKFEVLGCVLSLTDISAQKRAEAERATLLDAERVARGAAEHARTEAETSSRSKDEFLATVSHELKTPLNAIVGWARLLHEGGMSEEHVQKGVEVIRRNANAQSKLIEDLLDVSRIVSGHMRLDVQRLDPVHVVRAVIESLRPAIEAKQITLEPDLDGEPLSGDGEAEPVFVVGDETRIQQIVWNLLSNAVKFTPKNGRIEVSLRSDDATLELCVEDDGPGISADFLPYVFDRFRQADGSFSRVHGGLGLGLAIARHLVELHGGTIEVTSEGVGRGAAFKVRLPRNARESVLPEAPMSTHARPIVTSECADLKEISVLVVEDDDDSRDLLVNILVNCGAIVKGAGSAAEALRVLEVETPRVVVADIGMPEMDGYAFIRRVRSNGGAKVRAVPAIALTAYARAEDRRRALAAGFQMHLAKPLDPGELTLAIASLARYEAR